MERRQPIAITVISGLFIISLPLVLASAALAGVVYGIDAVVGLRTTHGWPSWLIAAPLLYVAWLVLMLGICALEMQVWARFLGYGKAARLSEREDRRRFYMILLCYMRQRMVWQLPLAQAFLSVDGLRQLLLWGAAPRLTLGKRSFLWGFLYDPDLTEIGDGVVVGGETIILAHSITTMPDGDRVYVSAPVTLGDRAVVGGGSRIDLGVRIGEDAIVEAMSNVTPFTAIGVGEVWGGNPARFRRMRTEAPAAALDVAYNISHSTSDTDGETRTIRQIVAATLKLPADVVTDDFSTDHCPAWDSLAQIGIASALEQTYRIEVPAEESFRLKSVADIQALVGRLRSPANTLAQPESPVAQDIPSNPELLPLMDHEVATSGLAARAQRSPHPLGDRTELTVAIAASFTAEPLAATLKVWSGAFGLQAEIEFAGFNQVPQSLLSPDSAFGRNRTGVNVVLVRPEDLLAGSEATHEQSMTDLLTAIRQFAERAPGTLVVGTLPPVVSPFFTGERRTVDRCRAEWHSRLEQIEGIELLDFAGVIERLGVDAARSTDMEVVARAPYSSAVYRELGIEMTRQLRRRIKAPAKVLALDADGVLWGGVLGEDGRDGVHLGPDHPGRAFQLFQQHVLSLRQRGILLVLVSRNNEADVWEMLDHHPEMKLRRSDFAAARINWNPKSRSLRELATELNLGLDAFVFVDDDVANRLEVEANAPGVIVVPLPADAAEYTHMLSRLWCFDSAGVTSEDLQRTAMMQQERLRQDDSAAASGMQSYLGSLNLLVDMRLAEAGDLPRVAQLTQKTNQFNLSLKRRSLAEIQVLARNGRVYVIRARDRFGEYGLIGVCILTPDASTGEFVFDTLLMSCRALGRGVEEALLYGVRLAAESVGATGLIAPFVEGPRNQPVRDFLIRSGFEERASGAFEHRAFAQLTLPSHVSWGAWRDASR